MLLASSAFADASDGAEFASQPYMVLPGDTLETIAALHDVHVDSLIEWNPEALTGIRRGSVLTLFTPEVVQRRVRAVYIVRKGDTLEKIGGWSGMTSDQVRWLNAEQDLDSLVVGQSLTLFAKVDHRRQGVGKNGRQFHSRIQEPTWLAPLGRGFVTKNPNTTWGSRRTVELLEQVLASVADRHPGAAPIVVGDLSRRRGGRFRPHLSHRKGRDADIGYPVADAVVRDRFHRVDAETIDIARTWDLVRGMLLSRHVEFIFIGHRLQRPLWNHARSQGVSESVLEELFQFPRRRNRRQGIIRHARGHMNHLHVRFRFTRAQLSDEAWEALLQEAPSTASIERLPKRSRDVFYVMADALPLQK
jgi:LysM repeat protein